MALLFTDDGLMVCISTANISVSCSVNGTWCQWFPTSENPPEDLGRDVSVQEGGVDNDFDWYLTNLFDEMENAIMRDAAQTESKKSDKHHEQCRKKGKRESKAYIQRHVKNDQKQPIRTFLKKMKVNLPSQ